MLARLKVPLALAVAAGAIAWLVATGVARNDLYMSTLDQMDPARARREPVKVMGFVADGSVEAETERLVTRFALRNDDASLSMPVRYAGVTPDLFRDGASVIATGRLDGDGTFVATDLMTKCPSKYEGVDHPDVMQDAAPGQPDASPHAGPPRAAPVEGPPAGGPPEVLAASAQAPGAPDP